MALTHVLLFFHLLGAFCFFAGGAVVGVLQIAAIRRERPSEVHALLRLAPFGAALVGTGALLTLGFGIALAEHEGLGLSPAWIQAALGLWVAAMVLGAFGGRTARRARHLAAQLAAEGDAPSPELRALVSARGPLWASDASGLLLLAIVVLMVWQPGGADATYSAVLPVSVQQAIVREHPQFAYFPTSIPAGYSYFEQQADWPTRFALWFVRFGRSGQAPDNLDFVVFEGSCPTTALRSFSVNGISVSWSGRHGIQSAWRCLPAAGTRSVVIDVGREIPGDDRLDTRQRREDALRLAEVVVSAKRVR